MNLTTWLDVALGLTLIFLGASLLVTAINEYVGQMMNLRGKELCKSLLGLVDDAAVRQKLAKNPALARFFGEGKALSYVDTNVLARMLLGGTDDTLAAASGVKELGAAIDRLPDSSLKLQLQAIARTAGDKVDDLVTAVSAWADRSLTMLGEVYKKKMQRISLAIGFTVAVLFNIDTVGLTMHLYRDREAREAAATLAVQLAEQTDRAAFDRCMALSAAQRRADLACGPLDGLVESVRGRNASLGRLPLGWAGPRPGTTWEWAIRGMGWVLTALAVSVGAPFWFDLLNRFVNIRHTMRKPEVKAAGERT
jgi:hypothetical protein